jgi:hypothetical protein
MSDQFKGLEAIVQYRLKDHDEQYDPWHNMAAFDVKDVAENYANKMSKDSPWKYRVIDAVEEA